MLGGVLGRDLHACIVASEVFGLLESRVRILGRSYYIDQVVFLTAAFSCRDFFLAPSFPPHGYRQHLRRGALLILPDRCE